MFDAIALYFKFDQLKTDYKTEIIAGATTFITMAYIIIVHPKILEAAGIPLGPSIVVTIMTAFLGTFIMGVYARRPFAIAPYMAENAFIAYTVCNVLGYSWQSALGAIFIGGLLFVLISIFKLRSWLASAIPHSLKIAFAVGIGLFLTFIGFSSTGIVKLGVEGAPVHVGNFNDPQILVALFGFLLMSFMMVRKVKGALLLGIIITAIIAFVFKIAPLPTGFISMPPSIEPVFLKLDITASLQWGFFSVILTVFILDFVDTTGTLLGLSVKSNLLDENGELPEIEKPMICDSLSTVIAALLGTTTSGVFLESAAGIESGGRSGFTSVVTALLFLFALFFTPIFTAVPACAYSPALIVVGFLMLTTISELNFNDMTEYIPAFCVIVFMSFTFNPGIGMTAGFLSYTLLKLFVWRPKEISSGMWVLTGLSLLFFILYPY